MGLLDLFKKKKEQKDEQKVRAGPPNPMPEFKQDAFVKPETHEQATSLNLSKKIGLNFTKMNLDDENVRKNRVFLLDVSGSMDEKVHDVRKIDSLREVMKKYTDARKICFSSSVSQCPDIPEPNGGTNLARALRYIKSKETPLPERIVLVSDGEPDSKSDAKKAAEELALPIDIIFIGEERSGGHKFMEELATLTRGEHFVV